MTTLVAYLLTALHAKAQGAKTSLWLHLSELRATLFQRPRPNCIDIDAEANRKLASNFSNACCSYENIHDSSVLSRE